MQREKAKTFVTFVKLVDRKSLTMPAKDRSTLRCFPHRKQKT